jgi:hypothetical protein
VENTLIGSDTNEKLNISILCPVNRIGSSLCIFPGIYSINCYLASISRGQMKERKRILGGIITGLVLSIISLTALAIFLAYRK